MLPGISGTICFSAFSSRSTATVTLNIPENIQLFDFRKNLRGSLRGDLAYLDENYTKKITLDELAERYYINKFYLTRIFKAQYGTSINAYLQEIRITQAKHELRFSDKSIEEIATECGIGELYYFSRVFKNIEGISPSEYRKQWNSTPQ